MVRIINYKTRQKEDGTEFYVLEVQGGIEMIKSKTSGQYYATAKKALVPTTFDEATCKGLIGTEFPGSITKITTEPYQYSIKETGEVISLEHRYIYLPEDVETDEAKLAKSLEQAFN
ncbi:hypothetical protein G6R40_09615 [Chryseobacterium sp. POL2]|uniref:hypothetical protein n=1 Tax=Chryseobacterium sp. POL2 TaxID=2713414 RepID=UPI0013E0EC3F|nr:hypothetical protein [Chryseobacterium sp. POL2]QIG89901.1 hypothetical protein G6R40_09615 [Chryseobacterium sp. POL2]